MRDIDLFNNYMNKYFPKLGLSLGLFYKTNIALRFETGLNSPPYNNEFEKYVQRVYIKSQLLFNAINDKKDDLFFVVNIRQDAEEDIPSVEEIDVFKGYIKNKNLIRNIDSIKLTYYLYEDDEEDNIVTYRCILKCKVKDIRTKDVLQAIANKDIGLNPKVYEECFFINIDKQIIYNLYDDRGFDIIGHKKENLQYLHDKYNEWLIDYYIDIEKMNKIFREKYYCPICGCEREEVFEIGDICACCGNERGCDDSIEKLNLDTEQEKICMNWLKKLLEEDIEIPK